MHGFGPGGGAGRSTTCKPRILGSRTHAVNERFRRSLCKKRWMTRFAAIRSAAGDAARTSWPRWHTATMPELPDIAVYIDRLTARIVGRRLDAVRLLNPFLLRTAVPPIASTSGRT